MKKLAMKEALRKKLTKAGALALAAVVAMGGGVTYYNSQNQVPDNWNLDEIEKTELDVKEDVTASTEATDAAASSKDETKPE